MILNKNILRIERKVNNPLYVNLDKYQLNEFLRDFERIDISLIKINNGIEKAISKYDIKRIFIYNQEGVRQLLVDHIRLRIVDTNDQLIKAEIY